MKRTIAAILVSSSFAVITPSALAGSLIYVDQGKAKLVACDLQGNTRVSIFQGEKPETATKHPLVSSANGSGCVEKELVPTTNPNENVYVTPATSNSTAKDLKILVQLNIRDEVSGKKASAPTTASTGKDISIKWELDGNFSVKVCHGSLDLNKPIELKVGNAESIDNKSSKPVAKDGLKCVERKLINTVGGGKPLFIVQDGKVLGSLTMPSAKGSAVSGALNVQSKSNAQANAQNNRPAAINNTQQAPRTQNNSAPAAVPGKIRAKSPVGLQFSFKNDPNWPIRYGVVVDVECAKADLVKIAAYDDGDKPDFNKVKTQNLTSTHDGFCRLNQEISPKDIEEQVLEVRLYKTGDEGKNIISAGAPVFLRVPCDGIAANYAKSKTTLPLVAGVQNISTFDCPVAQQSAYPMGIPNVQNGQQQSQPVQSCSIQTKLFGASNAQVQILARCDLDALGTEIYITQNGQSKIEKTLNFKAGVTREVAIIDRPLQNSISFDVRMVTQQGQFNSHKTFFKDPSFNYEPEVTLLSSQNETPERARKLNFRGYKWESEVKVKVSDRDVDNKSQELIDVELYNKTLDRVVGEATVANDSTVTFPLKVDYIIPITGWGKKFWNDAKDEVNLQKGKNVLVIRVYDAYQEDRYIELPTEIIVDVRDKVEETEAK